jgi:5-methylthioadenosine/S-adenosylhomocysteine deaminase
VTGNATPSSPGSDAASVVFFDPVGTLLERTPGGYRRRPEAARWLATGTRLGILCNAGPGRSRRDVLALLEQTGLAAYVEPDLVVVASELPCPLPDPRAFAVAAALAASPVDRCSFVSADPALAAAAARAGMRVLAPEAGDEAGTPGLLAAGAEAVEPALLAGEVYEDTGPTFVLKGRLVAMATPGAVLDDARVAVQKGFVRAVAGPDESLPAAFADAPVIETGGTIYPGMMDLHNHYAYNVLPLWAVPKTYQNRSQWPRDDGYRGEVSLPINALKSYSATARAIVRYVEAKALVGGTTTGQGIRTQVNGGVSLFRGAMRNVEVTGDHRLPEAGTSVVTLFPSPDRVDAFRNGLQRRGEAGGVYFYHLAEGVDGPARQTFLDLENLDLLQASLVGIHSLGLASADLREMGSHGCRIVWSPFSNLLLYGRTMDPAWLRDCGAPFSIGCDWSPTGSKNLLEELKVARQVCRDHGDPLSSEDLVRAVTADAARVVGWQRFLGTVEPDRMADLVVVAGDTGDPFDGLIDARERDVRLVLVHGRPRYGDADLMGSFARDPGTPVERRTVDGTEMAFDLWHPDSPLNGLTLADAERTLREAMSDLPAFRDEQEQQRAGLAAFGVEEPSFTLELDNELPDQGDEGEFGLLANWDLLTRSVDLDPLEVGGADYWQRVDAEANVGDSVKEALRRGYR